uniref:NADH-ubiquinone oxidoreductase chain 6 n=1 Tax=Harmonia quadripunctata TaxID=346781 RepID=A0A343C307_HARQU|nr:NADH dehydrogenase subunit 6 [Harmonia quadripunctata]
MNLLMLTTMMSMFMKHPLSLGFLILIHTITMCLIMGLMSINFWFSYILMLIMIGGLLVLFIYMTSTAANEKFKFNKYIILMTFLTIMFTLTYMIMHNNYLLNMNLNNEMLNKMDLNQNFYFNLIKFLIYPNSNIFVILMFYLLTAMIAIVKITKVKFGPLRQFKYENTYT